MEVKLPIVEITNGHVFISNNLTAALQINGWNSSLFQRFNNRPIC